MEMKMVLGVLLFLCLSLTAMGQSTASPVVIKSCYYCEGDNPCKPEKKECEDVTVPPVGGGTDAPSDANAERLVKKRQGEDEGEGAAVSIPVPEKTVWKCITMTGKTKKDEKLQMWKGCATGCQAVQQRFPLEMNCEDCDNKDNCNSVQSINPIGWIFFMTSLICVGWQ